MVHARWRDVIGFEQFYEVSTEGTVRRKVAEPLSRGAEDRAAGTLVRQHHLKSGYRVVNLRNGNKWHSKLVHRLVLEAFTGPCPEFFEAQFKNGQRDDVRAENLVWGFKGSNRTSTKREEEYESPLDLAVEKEIAALEKALRKAGVKLE